jgi:hypothetical protein
MEMLVSQKSPSNKKSAAATAYADLWHNSYANPKMLGCPSCPDFQSCKGLAISAAVMSCAEFCCGNPEKCDRPCRNNVKDFAFRVREVNGFDLGNTPRAKSLALPELPRVVPVIYHGKNFGQVLETKTIALPLYQLFSRRDGRMRFSSKEQLFKTFHLDEDTIVIATGTDKDEPIERFWAQGDKRVQIAAALAKQGVSLATTPNFSVFSDVPRTVDLHAMKRIALVGSEFMNAGLATAIHINGRTDGDFERWTDFLGVRPEVLAIAYEFKTGAGRAERIHQHVEWLCGVAKKVNRPLNLILRAGHNQLHDLCDHFDRVTVLETTSFQKTINRQKAIYRNNMKPSWISSPTPVGQPLDYLFEHNRQAFHAWLEEQFPTIEEVLKKKKAA